MREKKVAVLEGEAKSESQHARRESADTVTRTKSLTRAAVEEKPKSEQSTNVLTEPSVEEDVIAPVESDALPATATDLDPETETGLVTSESPSETTSPVASSSSAAAAVVTTPQVSFPETAPIVRTDAEAEERLNQKRFRQDIVILKNDECAPLAEKLQATLEQLLYIVHVESESSLVRDPTYAFLASTRKLVWILTSSVWSYQGCVGCIARGVELDMDIVIIRQDGAMWNGFNFPTYESIPKSVAKVFSNKAIEHVTPFYEAFVAKVIDRLAQPKVRVWKELRSDMSLADRNTNLFASLERALTSTSEEMDQQVASSNLLITEWNNLYDEESSSADFTASLSALSVTSWSNLAFVTLRFVSLFNLTRTSEARPLLVDRVDQGLKEKKEKEDGKSSTTSDAAVESSSPASSSHPLARQPDRIRGLSGAFSLLSRCLTHLASSSSELSRIATNDSLTLLLNITSCYAPPLKDGSLHELVDMSVMHQALWQCMKMMMTHQLSVPSSSAALHSLFLDHHFYSILIASFSRLIPFHSGVTQVGLELLTLSVDKLCGGKSEMLFANCSPLSSADASSALLTALQSIAIRYSESKEIMPMTKELATRCASSASSSAPVALTELTSASQSSKGVDDTPTGPVKEHDVFLSHRQIDCQDMVKRLKLEYESAGFKCFLDRDDASFLADLPAIVRASRIFLFVLSPTVLRSIWCCQELMAAMESPTTRIVLVKLEDTVWMDAEGRVQESKDEFPPDSCVTPTVLPYIHRLRAESARATVDRWERISPVIHHSSYYFGTFFAALLQVCGAPSIRINERVSRHRQLADNFEACLDVSSRNKKSGGLKSTALYVACVEKLNTIIRSQSSSFQPKLVTDIVWRDFVRTLVATLHSTMYVDAIDEYQRMRTTVVLLDMLTTLISANRTLVMEELITLSRSAQQAHDSSNCIIQLLTRMIPDWMDETEAQGAILQCCRVMFGDSVMGAGAGASATNDASSSTSLLQSQIVSLSSCDFFRRVMGLIGELATGVPPHVTAARAQLQAVSEVNINSTDVARAALIDTVKKERHGEELQRARSEACKLLNRWIVNGDGEGVKMANETHTEVMKCIAPFGLAQLVTPACQPLFSVPDGASVLRSIQSSLATFSSQSWCASHATSPLPILRPDPVAGIVGASDAGHSEGEWAMTGKKVFVMHDPRDREADKIARALKAEVERHPDWSVEFECEHMSGMDLTERSGNRCLLILSPAIFNSAINRAWLNGKKANACTLVRMTSARWMIDGVANKYPPTSDVSVERRTRIIDHSWAYYNTFTHTVLHDLFAPDNSSHRVTAIPRLHHVIPELIARFRQVRSQQVESVISRLHWLLDFVALTFATPHLLTYEMRSMPSDIWVEFFQLLLHRILQLQSMPDYMPARLEKLSTMVRIMMKLIGQNAASYRTPRMTHFDHMIRQSDGVLIHGLMRAMKLCQSDEQVILNSTHILACLLPFKHAHQHPLRLIPVPVPSSDDAPRLKCDLCYEEVNPQFLSHVYVCGECKSYNNNPVWYGCLDCTRPPPSTTPIGHVCSKTGQVCQPTSMVRQFGVTKCQTAGCNRLQTKWQPSKDELWETKEPGEDDDMESPEVKDYKLLMKCGPQAQSCGYVCRDCGHSQCRLCFEGSEDGRSMDAYTTNLVAPHLLNHDAVNYFVHCFLCQPQSGWLEKRTLVSNICEALARLVELASDVTGKDEWITPRLVTLNTMLSVDARQYDGGGLTIRAQFAFTELKEKVQRTVGKMTSVSTEPPRKVFNQYPYLLCYDRMDSDAARSVRLSIESHPGFASMGQGKVWTDEDATGGDWHQVAEVCKYVIVLLGAQAFDNPFIMSVCRNVVASSPERLVLVKLDGVTWRGQLYPPVEMIPPTLRAYFSEVIASSRAAMKGEVVKKEKLMVRYIRDYFSDFFQSLAERILPNSSSGSGSGLFAMGNGIGLNVANLTLVLDSPDTVRAKQQKWKIAAAKESSSASDPATGAASLHWSISSASFRTASLHAFCDLYSAPGVFKSQFPDDVTARVWERLMIVATTQLMEARKMTKVIKDAPMVQSIQSFSLALIRLVTLCTISSSVRDLLFGSGVELVAPLASASLTTQQYLLGATPPTSSAPLFPQLHQATAEILGELYHGMCQGDLQAETGLMTILKYIRIGGAFWKTISYRQVTMPHPAMPFDLYKYTLRQSRVDQLLVNCLRQVHSRDSLMETRMRDGSATELNEGLLLLYTIIGDQIRCHAFSPELYPSLLYLIMYDLARFNPSKNHNLDWMRALCETLASVIQLNGGCRVTDDAGGNMIIDLEQLVPLLFRQLSNSLHADTSFSITVAYIFYLLTSLVPDSRALLLRSDSGFVDLLKYHFAHRGNVARFEKKSVPTWLEYYLLQTFTYLLCSVDYPHMTRIGVIRSPQQSSVDCHYMDLLTDVRENIAFLDNVRDWFNIDQAPDVSKDGEHGGAEVRALIKHMITKVIEDMVKETSPKAGIKVGVPVKSSLNLRHAHPLKITSGFFTCDVCGVASPSTVSSFHACAMGGCSGWKECHTCYGATTAPFNPHIHPLQRFSDGSASNLYRSKPTCAICTRMYEGEIFICRDARCRALDSAGMFASSYAECEDCYIRTTGQGYGQLMELGLTEWKNMIDERLTAKPSIELIHSQHIFYCEVSLLSLPSSSLPFSDPFFAHLELGISPDRIPVVSTDICTQPELSRWLGVEMCKSTGSRRQGVEYTPQWKEGDTIGLLVDAYTQRLQWSVNGKLYPPSEASMGFWEVQTASPTVALRIATQSAGDRVKLRFNFGDQPFVCKEMNTSKSRIVYPPNTINMVNGQHTPDANLKITANNEVEYVHPSNVSTDTASVVLHSSQPMMHDGIILSSKGWIDSTNQKKQQADLVLSDKLRQSKPLPASTLQSINLPIDMSLLPSVVVSDPSSSSSSSSETSSLYDLPQLGTCVYYELTLVSIPSNLSRTRLEFGYSHGHLKGSFAGTEKSLAFCVDDGVIWNGGYDNQKDENGKPIIKSLKVKDLLKDSPFQSGDILGCGLYGATSTSKACCFFTRNGKPLVTIPDHLYQHIGIDVGHWYPHVSTRGGEDKKSPVKFKLNFGQEPFAFTLSKEHEFCQRPYLQLQESTYGKRLVIDESHFTAKVASPDDHVHILTKQPVMFKGRPIGQLHFPIIDIYQDANDDEATSKSSKPTMTYYELTLVSEGTTKQSKAPMPIELGLIFQEGFFEPDSYCYGHTSCGVWWSNVDASFHSLRRGSLHTSGNREGRFGRSIKVGETIGLGFSLKTNSFFLTHSGELIYEYPVEKSMLHSYNGYIRVGLGQDGIVEINMGREDVPFKFDLANQFAEKRPDLRVDLFGASLKVQSDIDPDNGNEFQFTACGHQSWFGCSEQISQPGCIVKCQTSGEYGDDGDEALMEEINYPDEVRDSRLLKVHALMQQYVSQEKFAMPNYLPKAATSSLSNASPVDEFATQLHSLSHSSGHILYPSHSHWLTRQVSPSNSNATCSTCQTKISSTKKPSFACHLCPDNYVECGSCFVTHSGMMQFHLHELSRANGTIDGECYYCAEKVPASQEVLRCVECSDHVVCSTCDSVQQSCSSTFIQRVKSLADWRQSDAAQIALMATRQATMIDTKPKFPIKPFSPADLKHLTPDAKRGVMTSHYIHDHPLSYIPKSTTGGNKFTCSHCGVLKHSSWFKCSLPTCDGFLCCIGCIIPGVLKPNESNWNYDHPVTCHAHYCNFKMHIPNYSEGETR